MDLRPGLTAQVVTVVGPDDTAVAVGSGDLPVLGTPRLLALAEAATVAAVRDRLAPGRTSVGTRVALTHLHPSPVGTAVRVTATLDRVDGRLLRFEVVAEHPADGLVVAHGQLTRVVVDRERFLANPPPARGG